MTFEQIITNLKKRQYATIYLLMGEEPYFIDIISDYISKNVLNEAEKAFNQTIFYGKDTDAATVINAAKRYPMGSEYQVVIVKEAQNLRNIDDLHYYALQPLNSTILVINYKFKKYDKRKKFYKLVEEKGILFESKPLYENKVPDWISSYLKPKGMNIQPPAAMLLTEFIGNNLSKVVNELEKLQLAIPQGENTITTSHIEENIGISKDFNNIELQKALIKRDALKAYRIAEYFGDNQKNNPFVVTITSLYMFFNKVLLTYFLKDKSKASVATALKVNPFFVNDYLAAARSYSASKTVEIIGLLRQYDLKSKGVGNISTGPGELLRELIFKILN